MTLLLTNNLLGLPQFQLLELKTNDFSKTQEFFYRIYVLAYIDYFPSILSYPLTY